MKLKPSLPKGMRDFLPAQVAKRRYIIQTIQSVFEKYGFQPIETPVMENLTTLTGKYGEEGDRLLFKVLNSGDYLKRAKDDTLDQKDSKKLTFQISEKGLRYDLTVPLARYVVQNQNALSFPFKRYHIAPVWRADRPQKGRYREFYQCDADVIGSKSLINEVELLQIYAEVFAALNLDVEIKINNRKLLMGLIESIGLKEKANETITILDKLDKVGLDKVLAEIESLGIQKSKIQVLKTAITENKTQHLEQNAALKAGLEELEFLQKYMVENSKIDISLARGLDYYTGCIFEVTSNEVQIGSLAGGGRYDSLTEIFGKHDLTGVGISFGLDRIYDVLEETSKWPDAIHTSTKLLFVHFDEASRDYAFEQLQIVRNAQIACEIYPDIAKLKKQMKYAHDKHIPYVVVIGDNEIESGALGLKNMETGQQDACSLEEIIQKLR